MRLGFCLLLLVESARLSNHSEEFSIDMSSLSEEDGEDEVVSCQPWIHPVAAPVLAHPSVHTPATFTLEEDEESPTIEVRPLEIHPVQLRRYHNAIWRRCYQVACIHENLACLAFLVSLITVLSLVMYFRK